MGSIAVLDTKPRTDFQEQEKFILNEIAVAISDMLEERRFRILSEQSELLQVTNHWGERLQLAVKHVLGTLDKCCPSDVNQLQPEIDALSREIFSGLAMIQAYRQVKRGESIAVAPIANLRSSLQASTCSQLTQLVFPSIRRETSSSKLNEQTYMPAVEFIDRLKKLVNIPDTVTWPCCDVTRHSEVKMEDEVFSVLFTAMMNWLRDPSLSNQDQHPISLSFCIDEAPSRNRQVEKDGFFVVRVTHSMDCPDDSIHCSHHVNLINTICGTVLRSLGGDLSQREASPTKDGHPQVMTLLCVPCRHRLIIKTSCSGKDEPAAVYVSPEIAAKAWHPVYSQEDIEPDLEGIVLGTEKDRRGYQPKAKGLTIAIIPGNHNNKVMDDRSMYFGSYTTAITPCSGQMTRKLYHRQLSSNTNSPRTPTSRASGSSNHHNAAVTPKASSKLSVKLTTVVRSLMGLLGGSQGAADDSISPSNRRKVTPL